MATKRTRRAMTVRPDNLQEVSFDDRCDAIRHRRCEGDLLYNFITNPDKTDRLRFIGGIKAFLAETYADEMSNNTTASFRSEFEQFFLNASRKDSVGSGLQMYIIYVAIAFYKQIAGHFCPPPPAPNSNEPDLARVDRRAFSTFQTQYLMSAISRMMSGSVITIGDTEIVPSILQECKQLSADYATLMAIDS